VAYAFNKTWRDGSTHVVMEPQVLIERLLALVPRPRRHLVTYHGMLLAKCCVMARERVRGCWSRLGCWPTSCALLPDHLIAVGNVRSGPYSLPGLAARTLRA
jgi:hypothetical protein